MAIGRTPQIGPASPREPNGQNWVWRNMSNGNRQAWWLWIGVAIDLAFLSLLFLAALIVGELDRINIFPERHEVPDWERNSDRARRVILYGCGTILITGIFALYFRSWGTIAITLCGIGGGCILLGVAADFESGRQRRAIAKTPAQPPLCERCRYNLTGNVSRVCPECGQQIVK